MTFKQFANAIKSTWSAASKVTILLAVLAGIGVSSMWSEVPSAVSMVSCLLFYLAGFLASCYRSADEAMRAKKAHEEEIARKNAEMKAMRAEFAKNLAFSTAFYPDGPYVLRDRRDIVIEARDEAIREFERKSAERRRREMM